MPKTATKTFQHWLFAEHREIFYLGGSLRSNSRGRKSRDIRRKVKAVMGQIAYERIRKPDYQLCERMLNEVLSEPDAIGKIPVLSWEGYSMESLKIRRSRARSLKRLFGESKILMVIRSPIPLLEASYIQQLKCFNTRVTWRFGRGPYYLSIDEWLDRNFRKTDMPGIHYGETIRAFREVFGVENFNLLLFEDLVADEETYIRNVCRIMEIDPDEGVRLCLGKRDNERWTTAEIDSLKKLKGSFWQSLRYRVMSPEARKNLLGLDAKGESKVRGDRARAEISKEWQKRIFEVAHEGNRWVEDEFGVPLTKYGYFGNQ
jgi:hypothetical protein